MSALAWTSQDEKRHIDNDCTNVDSAEVTTYGALAPSFLEWCWCGEAARHTPMAEVNSHTPPPFELLKAAT